MRNTAVVLVLLVLSFPAAAYTETPLALDLNERVVRVPIIAKDLFRERTLFLETTIFKPNGNGTFPLLIPIIWVSMRQRT